MEIEDEEEGSDNQGGNDNDNKKSVYVNGESDNIQGEIEKITMSMVPLRWYYVVRTPVSVQFLSIYELYDRKIKARMYVYLLQT